ncbi:hypothetical protein K491DRAFT_722744 [Lophiostoma macrostomum CBS 122681]|uniref:Uncharacterized protein n=1 Tax=Lophiostoma macrostomum CBS 122681 TaxID=1314788 RepID=A0A6A6SMR4_9PLEO|nr:hypothetical protein K491DRAFT_722744 [Lophiostoma macrostomum CBS 122681]
MHLLPLHNNNRKDKPREKDHLSQKANQAPITDPTSSHNPATSSNEDSENTPTLASPSSARVLPPRTTSLRLQPNPPRNSAMPHARPHLPRHETTVKTRYSDMLFDANNSIPMWYSILASGFTWIVLAGWIVFPATFNKWQDDKGSDHEAQNELERKVLGTVRNLPLLYIATFACFIGVAGCVWLWYKRRKNYIWVIGKILIPSLMNSIAGLVRTLINIYTAQNGQFSVTAKSTIIVTGVFSVVTIILFLIWNVVLLGNLRRQHDKEKREYERELKQGRVGGV